MLLWSYTNRYSGLAVLQGENGDDVLATYSDIWQWGDTEITLSDGTEWVKTGPYCLKYCRRLHVMHHWGILRFVTMPKVPHMDPRPLQLPWGRRGWLFFQHKAERPWPRDESAHLTPWHEALWTWEILFSSPSLTATSVTEPRAWTQTRGT